MIKKQEQFRQIKIWQIVVATLVLFCILTVGQPVINAQLNALSLLPQPERFTELCFENSKNVPTRYSPGQQMTISFTVHNVEYKKTTYTYIISQQDENNHRVNTLPSVSFSLNQDETKTFHIPVQLVDTGAVTNIQVALSFDEVVAGSNISQPTNETIHYIFTKEGTK